MTKFMLMQNYEPSEGCDVMINEWPPEDVAAHIQFQRDLNDELEQRGELVGMEALTAPELAKFVVSDGQSPPVVTDGPFPESKELLAGYRLIDVESVERAIEIAAKASTAPGPGGKPTKTRIEVREVMTGP